MRLPFRVSCPTSVDDVCAIAGISKDAFYSHYESKDALIHTVAEMLSSKLARIDAGSVDALARSIFENQIAPAPFPQNSRFGIEMMAATRFDTVLSDRMTANLEDVCAAPHLFARGLPAIAIPSRSPASSRPIFLAPLSETPSLPGDGDQLRDEVRLLIRSLIAP